MSYRIEVLTGKPIIIQTCEADYTASETPALLADGMAQLDAAEQPVFYILDLRDIRLEFNDVLDALNLVTRGERPLFLHPNIRETLFVLQPGVISLLPPSLAQAVFRTSNIKAFETVEEALAYCDHLLAD